MIIREGSRGEAVLDVQARLAALGYDIVADERGGIFGPSTLDAVRKFQQDRGLLVDGIVGGDTWRQLVEASWRLGDRVLYLRAPQLRGDDVRELQDRLSTFGFDPGRADGIFGPATARAVQEFQRNYGLPPDGIVAEHTLRAFDGLPRIAGDTSVIGVREREAMRSRAAGLAGLRVVLDTGHWGEDGGAAERAETEACAAVLAHVAAALGAVGVQVYLSGSGADRADHEARVTLANTLEADLFLSVHACAEGVRAYYFGHARYRSEPGKRIAELLVQELGEGEALPKTFALLRETRMPAVYCQMGPLAGDGAGARLSDPVEQTRVAAAIVRAVETYAKVAASV